MGVSESFVFAVGTAAVGVSDAPEHRSSSSGSASAATNATRKGPQGSSVKGNPYSSDVFYAVNLTLKVTCSAAISFVYTDGEGPRRNQRLPGGPKSAA
jgi:hypothetical protein